MRHAHFTLSLAYAYKVKYTLALTLMDTAVAASAASSSCLTDVRVKAQYCHLEINQVLELEYLHVVLGVLFILNIAVIANVRPVYRHSSHTKLTQYR